MKLSHLNMNYVDSLSGRQFEFYLAEIFKMMGISPVHVTPASNDHGIDIILIDEKRMKWGIQCKLTSGNSIGYAALEELVGGMKYYGLRHGGVITNGLFSSKAQESGKRMGVCLWNRDNVRAELENLRKSYTNHIHKSKRNCPIRYSNIRVNTKIVRDLAILQTINGNHSRASLLHDMIKEIWPKVINTSARRNEAKKLLKIYNEVEAMKYNN